MGLTRLSLILALPGLLVASEAAPEPKDKKPKAEAGATVTVTAEAGCVEAVKTPNPVKIVTLERIQAAGAPDLARMLDQLLPGQVVRTGGPGATASLFLNGTRSKDVVVTLDGLPIRDGSSSGLNFSTISMTGVERMEVLTGSCSVLAGADAMGGVVALYSGGQAPEGTHGEVRAQAGEQGLSRQGFHLSQGWKGGWVRAGAERHQEDAPTESRHPYLQNAVFLGAGLDLGEQHQVSVNYRGSDLRVPLPWVTSHPTKPNVYDETRESRGRVKVGSARLTGLFGEGWSYEVVAGGDSQHRLEVATEKTPASPYDSTRQVAKGSVHRELQGWSFGLQQQEEREQGRMAYWMGGQNQGEASRRSTSAEAAVTVADRLRILGSVRFQRDEQTFRPVGGAERRNAHSSVAGRAGVNLLLDQGLRVYASMGTSYGLPEISAVLYNMGNAPDKPELGEEKGYSLLAGASWLVGAWTLNLDLNRSMYDKLVYFNGNGWYYANGSDVRVQSAELRADYRREGLHGGAFVRTQEARNLKASGGQLATSEVARRPFFSGGLQGGFATGAWRMEARWTYTGSYYDIIPYPTVRPSGVHYNDLACSVSRDMGRGLVLTLRGENLLQPRITKADWLAKRTDFQNDAYRAYNYPSQAPILSLEARYRF